MRKIITYLLLFLLAIACTDNKSNDAPQIDYGYAYFPLHQGYTWIDEVTHINIDSPSEVYDTINYAVKTVVDSVATYPEYEKFYCTRYRKSSNAQWVLEHVFWFERYEKKLLRFDQNEVWLDMVFPLYESLSWNPFAYNVYSDTSARNTVYRKDIFNMINGEPYDSTLVIHHQMDSTLVYKYTDRSFYGSGVGFLYRESVNIISDDPNYDYTLPIEERIKTATIILTKRNYND
ncbi:MAG: hypothetical protein R6U85_03735 [Salinivirgaceae bacterium]